jgi:hypothetical protein
LWAREQPNVLVVFFTLNVQIWYSVDCVPTGLPALL